MTIIRVHDLETNGLAPPAEVLEHAFCDVDNAQGEWIVGLPRATLHGCRAPLDPVARATHHIYPAELDGKSFFTGKEGQLSKGADAVAAHNWDFEAQWLADGVAPLPVICTYKAALRVWPDAPSHSNGALRYWLEDQGLIKLAGSAAQPAHRAGPDAYVTGHILKALLDSGVAGKDMVAWTKQPRLLPTCPIGKERGKKWADVDAGFLDWMCKQPAMEADLKWNARRELDRRAMEKRT